jgi:pimeloyl-ACP methyl ester carboxylesterase
MTSTITPRHALLALALALPLIACTSGSDAQQDFSGLIDAGARKLYAETRGSGSPAVVLISGLGGAADYWDNPAATAGPTVASEVSRFARVFTWDRPGTVRNGDDFASRSDPIPQPSSEQSAVADLHALLAATGTRGPYILAAHSYGGFIARLYASTYPDEVAGMVLIDALSEGFADAMTPEQLVQWRKIQQTPADTIAQYPAIERMDIDAVLAQIRAAPPMRPMPLTVLSADRLWAPDWQAMIDSGQLPPDTPADLGLAIDAAQKISQDYQAHLVPGARHITETHSGHDIPLENPALVIEAIRELRLSPSFGG